jgi:hypothetical protein
MAVGSKEIAGTSKKHHMMLKEVETFNCFVKEMEQEVQKVNKALRDEAQRRLEEEKRQKKEKEERERKERVCFVSQLVVIVTMTTSTFCRRPNQSSLPRPHPLHLWCPLQQLQGLLVCPPQKVF